MSTALQINLPHLDTRQKRVRADCYRNENIFGVLANKFHSWYTKLQAKEIRTIRLRLATVVFASQMPLWLFPVESIEGGKVSIIL